MNDTVFNCFSLTTVAAALTEAMGVPAPLQADAPNPAMKALVENSGVGQVDRILMYNPDAIALWLYQKYTEYYLPVQKHTSLTVPLQSVMPSVTPVCFGTMYTGALPEVHGIKSYTKPVIKIDTLFDALLRAGKKPAIVSTEGDSLSKIFLEREMDYYIYPTVEEVHAKAMELLAADKYDFILVYNASYDSTMHRNAPEGEASLAALRDNMKKFDELAEAVKTHWTQHNTLIGFAPDHGCHEIDGGLGSHGLDMPEDLNILHFYGVIPAK
ncbi:MAG: alkaline phosphatase family protein [Clostridia bacterium]|nr:alkaline phosphatase family protein [Clostridia bacterium]